MTIELVATEIDADSHSGTFQKYSTFRVHTMLSKRPGSNEFGRFFVKRNFFEQINVFLEDGYIRFFLVKVNSLLL